MTNSVGTFHLILSRKKNTTKGLSARLTSTTPKLAAGEVAMSLIVEIPVALFERPILQAEVRVPPQQSLDSRITANVADGLSKTLTERLGMSVNVTAAPLASDRHWSEVLGVDRNASTSEARAAYRALHSKLMADETTEPADIKAVTQAWDQACRDAEIQE